MKDEGQDRIDRILSGVSGFIAGREFLSRATKNEKEVLAKYAEDAKRKVV